MLDDLVGVIATLQGRIEQHRPALSQSEALTRYALIDPLLRVLGWDTADPALVTPEYTVGNGRADYALLGGGDKPQAFIEAKRLDETLESPRNVEQIFTYALTQRVKYAGLTDGNRWVLDDVSDFSGSERRKLSVSLSGEPAHQIALKLLLLWRPNLATGEPVAAAEPILAVVDPAPAVLPANPTPAATVVNPQPSVPAGDDWVDVSLYTPERRDSPKPMAILFPGEREKPIQSWRQVLRETAEWLIRTNQLTADKCPVMRGTTTCVVNTASHHANGTDFGNPSQLSNGLYMNQRRGNVEVSESTKALLRRFGVDAGAVWLKLNP